MVPKTRTRPGNHEWHWIAEYISAILYPGDDTNHAVSQTDLTALEVRSRPGGASPHPKVDPEPTAAWNWCPLDLSVGSEFYLARLDRLRKVTEECNGPQEWIIEGVRLLGYHRENYGPNGPRRLTVLWWEWLKEHWKALREGSSMNFLVDPSTGLMDNS